MWMSMFSSFEAFGAESLSQRVALSRSPASASNNMKQEPAAAAVKIDDLKKGEEVNSSSPPPKKPENRQMIRAPRFAPEFDGIYCFETIIPY
ncbi:hypothetical protein ABFS82_06G015600 [Erythranthe guttata]|uniref:Uncharacterized protein n=1 Tax=Erythranthe guttata TaxID=4155 RepID=A0A022RXS8_ERYGU|nr:hypothetical protein MIMGU_mgv1a020920mg [Erythranthe guttata]